MTRTTRTRRPTRPAFTLIELLVVIAIIALLVSLSTAAYQRARVNATVRTSESVVTKIQMGLDNQVKIIADKVREDRSKPALQRSNELQTLTTACDGDEDRAAAVLLYCRLRQYLPQTQPELAAPNFTVGGVTFPRPVAFSGLAGIGGTPEQVSAAALYAALVGQSQGGNSFAADEALTGQQMDLTLGAVLNARVFKDGWGNPIPFVRFYQSAELDAPPYCDGKFGTGASPGKDPFDSWGKIYTGTTGLSAAVRGQVQGLGTSSLSTFAFGHNTTPMAYSFGLTKTPDSPIGSIDDILGYRLRSVGAKGGPKQ